jgi:hypothetical protein
MLKISGLYQLKKIKTMEQINYIKRLCQVAKEKSLFGYHSDSTYYFQKAIAIAETSNQFLCITEAIYKADLQNNKFLAYTAYLKSLDVAQNPVSLFRKTLKNRDLMPMVSEFAAKMPDMLFHHLMIQTETAQDRMELVALFASISKSVSKQLPFFLKNHAIRKAS